MCPSQKWYIQLVLDKINKFKFNFLFNFIKNITL